MSCSNCARRKDCYCKTCALERCNALSNIEDCVMASNCLRDRIMKDLENETKIKIDITGIEEKIMKFNSEIKIRKMRIKQKRDEIVDLSRTGTNRQEEVARSNQAFIETSANRKKTKEAAKKELDDREREIAELRQRFCRDILIENVLWGAKNLGIVSSNATNAILEFNLDLKVDEKGFLSDEIYSSLAAFTNTIQLTKFFNNVFDFRPPAQLEYREIGLGKRWTRNLILSDWKCLFDSIVYLCAFVGINPKILNYNDPNYNLVQLIKFVVHGNGDIRKIGSKALDKVAEIQQSIAPLDLNEDLDVLNDTWSLINSN